MPEITFQGHQSFLSNHYPCRIVAEDMAFNSSEQYYIYLKAKHLNRPDIIEMIMKEEYADNISKISMKYFTADENAIWKNYSDDAMWTCLLAKFYQNRNLTVLLIDTVGYTLRENTKNKYWGGKNNALGKMLMKIRDRFV